MKSQENINNKSTGFKIPKAYFESFENRLWKSISKKKSTTQDRLPKEGGFEIPEAYFDSVEKSIFDQTIRQKETKVVSLWSQHIGKVAAILLILITGYGVLQVNYDSFQKEDGFSNISDKDLELYIENHIFPYSEMQNLMETESNFEIADNAMKELNREVILHYLDDELDDLDLIEE